MFDARHPDTPRMSVDPEAPHRLAPTRVDPALLAKVGDTFAASLSSLQSALAALDSAADRQARVADAVAECARLEQIGIRIQKIGRMLDAHASQKSERVDLRDAAQAAVSRWQPARERELIVTPDPGRAIEVDVDPAALVELIELAVCQGLELGAPVELRCAPADAWSPPTFSLLVRRRVSAGAGEQDAEPLHWLLFAHLAHAFGLAPRRIVDGPLLTVSVALPARTSSGAQVAAPSPLTDAPPRTPPIGRRHVLLVEPDEATRFAALALMRSAGLDVDPAATIEQASESLHHRPPDIVVVGLRDAASRGDLIERARAAQPRLHVVELIDDDDAFEFAADADHPARVGRHELARTLLAAMAQGVEGM